MWYIHSSWTDDQEHVYCRTPFLLYSRSQRASLIRNQRKLGFLQPSLFTTKLVYVEEMYRQTTGAPVWDSPETVSNTSLSTQIRAPEWVMLRDICICFSRKCHLSQADREPDSSQTRADPTGARLRSAPEGFALPLPSHRTPSASPAPGQLSLGKPLGAPTLSGWAPLFRERGGQRVKGRLLRLRAQEPALPARRSHTAPNAGPWGASPRTPAVTRGGPGRQRSCLPLRHQAPRWRREAAARPPRDGG